MSAFAIALYDVVLFVHIAAVVVAFGGGFLYPMFLAVAQRAAPTQRVALHEAQVNYGRRYASFGLLVVILAGAYMATDRDLWGVPWVGGPFLIALVIGGIGGAYLGPRERRLAELAERDDDEYRGVLRQVRTGALITSGLVLVAIFLMVTKLGA